MSWLEILATFGLGIFAAIIVKRWEIHYHRPVIRIEDGITVGINLDYGDIKKVPFVANRIKVRNTGRSGAKDCKVYVEFSENDIERTAWMLPDNLTAYSLILNVNIPEYVDLCAISEYGMIRVITLEHGFKEKKVGSCRILPQGNHEITVRVASSNAQPAARKIKLHDRKDYFPGEYNRFVEFIS